MKSKKCWSVGRHVAGASPLDPPLGLFFFYQALVDNGTGYLVGDSITLADLGLLEPLLNMEDYLGAQHLDDYPALKVDLTSSVFFRK